MVPVLPGSVLVLGAVLVWAIEVATATGWAVFAVAAALLLSARVVKYAVPGRRLKRAGVPSSTLLLGALLGVVGFFVIPVVGVWSGFVLGVYLAELRAARPRSRRTGDGLGAQGRRTLDADRVPRLPAAAATWAFGLLLV